MLYNGPLILGGDAVLSLRNISLLCVAVMSAVSVYLAASLPLSPDEAHYALYGSHLALSYFDHPPMVGWVQALMLLISDTDFWLRLPPLLVSLATGVLLFRFTRRYFDEASAWLSVVFFSLLPMFRMLGLAWVPEDPLMLAGLTCLWATLALAEKNTLSLWLLLGASLGVAALSKYTAVTLALSVALALFYLRGPKVLLEKGLWLAVLVAGLLLLPILIWNYQHDWISFNYQLEHGTERHAASLLAAGQMQLGQILAYSPLVYVVGIVASVLAWRNPTARVLMMFAWPILLLFSFSAFKGRSLPHWTAMGVLFLLPLISQSLLQLWQGGRLRKVLLSVLLLSAPLITLAMVLVLLKVNLGFKDYEHPLQDLIGWDEVAELTREVAEADPEADMRQILIPNWSYASRLAWYARPHKVKVLDTRVDQFDLWFGATEAGEGGYLILPREKDKFENKLLLNFADCEMVFVHQVESPQHIKINEFKVYRCHGYHP
jgi:4-amino-4-deoxy-L-arabinose transferase-like glycosyltransferase